MADTPEVKVKKKVVAILKELRGYGGSGVPDIVGCLHGKFFGIECKSGRNRPTALQQKNLDAIKAMGGIALVINEDNIDSVRYALGEM
jgi:Holliday junction resolvase